MFTQSKDPNNKNKPAYKKIVHTVTEQITPFLLVSKNNEMMQTNEIDLAMTKALLLHNTLDHDMIPKTRFTDFPLSIQVFL